MIADHYGSPVALRLLTGFVGILFTFPYVMMQIKAGGDLSAVLFRQHPHAFEVGAVVLAVITAIYVTVGGMRSVAWTDAIQCVLLLGGMLLAGLATIVSLGGLRGFSAAIANLPAASLTIPGTTGTWEWPFLFSVCLLMPLGGILQPAQWMRFYAARDHETLRRGALIFVVVLAGAFLFGIMPVGLSGQVMYPLEHDADGRPAPPAEVGEFDQILVVILSRELPRLLGENWGTLLASLFVVAIMAASMSTADSNLHALGGVVTRDFYERFVRRDAGESERAWVGRIVIFATTGGALGVVLAGQTPSHSILGFLRMIVDMALFAVAFSVQLLPITIDMLFLRRGSRIGAIAGLTAGIVVAFLFTTLFPMLVEGSSSRVLSALLDGVNSCCRALPIHASAWGLVANVVLFAGLSGSRSKEGGGRKSAADDPDDRTA
jgi:solute:Na+ symporter, SSS family